MTYEEAKEIIEDMCTTWSEDGDEALNMAIEALEKRIAKEPIYEADGYADGELVYDTWYCPNCNKSYEVDFDDYDFCPNCGQAIKVRTSDKADWSEEE